MSIEKYLNGQRTQELWTKIKTALSGKQDRLIPDETILIKDGGISVKTPVTPLTKEEYDGLSEEEKQAEAVYLVDEPPWTPIPLSIQEYDTEDGWHVRKWSNGYVEMFIRQTVSIPSNRWNNWLNVFVSVPSIFLSIPYPLTLVEFYSENVTESGPSPFFLFFRKENDSLRETRVYDAVRGSQAPSQAMNFMVDRKICGRWK